MPVLTLLYAARLTCLIISSTTYLKMPFALNTLLYAGCYMLYAGYTGVSYHCNNIYMIACANNNTVCCMLNLSYH
jgi:hypothetical protein